MTATKPLTRIQQKNRAAILDAALDVFSAHGYRGATVDQIALQAGLSKPNLLYYFPSKDAIHVALLTGLLSTWLAPLEQLDPDGEPVEEILKYVDLKLTMAETYPRESRLFANEIVQGAPRIHDNLTGPLRRLVDEKCAVIAGWIARGLIAPVDPHHLIFSIWATTQHYADFDVQVRAVLGDAAENRFAIAREHLRMLFSRLLTPGAAG